MHTVDGMADRFVQDVTREVNEIMKTPKKPVEGKVSDRLNKILKRKLMNLIKIFSVVRHLDGNVWNGTSASRPLNSGRYY